MAAEFRYHRILVMVREGAEAPCFDLAAELAHLLQLQLEGLFIENEALVSLAGFPFAREFTLPGHTWQALDSARMLEDFRAAAERARRLLAETAAARGLAAAFSVLRGDPMGALAREARAGDILVLVEPGASPVFFPRLARDASIFAPAPMTVLLVPSRPPPLPRAGQRSGGIAAVVPAAGDGAVPIAAAIALAAGENLVLISPGPGGTLRASTAASVSAFPPSRLQRRNVPDLEIDAIAASLRASGARLVVLDRADFSARDAETFIRRLVVLAGIPALLVGEGTSAEETSAQGGETATGSKTIPPPA